MTYSNTFDSDRALAVLGVPGRLTHRTTKPGGEGGALWLHQAWISEARPAKGYGAGAMIRAELNFDDACGNGHNTFAITGTVAKGGRFSSDAAWLSCGCIHDDLAKAFPELAALIRWHLTSSDGPMHYVANVVFHASDRDCWGKRAGEPSRFAHGVRFAGVPALHMLKHDAFRLWLESVAGYTPEGLRAALIPVAVAGDKSSSGYQFAPKYQFAGQPPLKWYECPFDSEDEAQRFAESWLRFSPEIVRVPTAWSEGKQRDLDAARRTAIWPEATDAELCAPPEELKAMLEARAPALAAEFRADMERAGFIWEPRLFPATIEQEH